MNWFAVIGLLLVGWHWSATDFPSQTSLDKSLLDSVFWVKRCKRILCVTAFLRQWKDNDKELEEKTILKCDFQMFALWENLDNSRAEPLAAVPAGRGAGLRKPVLFLDNECLQ